MSNAIDWLERAIGEHEHSCEQQPPFGADTAILQTPSGSALVTSIDTLVCGVHFTNAATAAEIGYKALAVNLSDLAAMGAKPSAALLSLSTTGLGRDWLTGFAEGFNTLADRFEVKLLAATLTDGPLAITVAVYGHLPAYCALRRDQAKVGDLIFVTGTLGDAGLALAIARGEGPAAPPDRHLHYLEKRLNCPEPRIAVGLALRNLASSAVDISDGLLADLNHVLTASHVGATVDVTRLPLSEAMIDSMEFNGARSLALSAGDDYELCFTVPHDKLSRLETVQPHLDCPIQHIGKIERDLGLRCVDGTHSWPVTQLGYQHFA